MCLHVEQPGPYLSRPVLLHSLTQKYVLFECEMVLGLVCNKYAQT
jgi:hypothetical protein